MTQETDDTTTANQPHPETLRGRYRLICEWGQGSQGKLVLAEDSQTGSEVAVKELDLKLVDEWKAVELFDREAGDEDVLVERYELGDQIGPGGLGERASALPDRHVVVLHADLGDEALLGQELLDHRQALFDGRRLGGLEAALVAVTMNATYSGNTNGRFDLVVEQAQQTLRRKRHELTGD